jgi:p-aminobenzoyl-glutamate transporter AbgT
MGFGLQDVIVAALVALAAATAAAAAAVLWSLALLALGRPPLRGTFLAVAWIAFSCWAVLVWAPVKADALLNGFTPQVFPELSQEGLRLHATLAVADLHADSLM